MALLITISYETGDTICLQTSIAIKEEQNSPQKYKIRLVKTNVTGNLSWK